MYVCRDCRNTFENPAEKVCRSSEYGDSRECFCPECGSESFYEVDECNCCGGWKPVKDRVCLSCHLYARRKLGKFAKEFSEAMREEMNEILCIDSLEDLVEALG